MPEQTARPNKPFESWVSDEAREHYRAARKEILMAWRTMIDDALEDMEKNDKKTK